MDRKYLLQSILSLYLIKSVTVALVRPRVSSSTILWPFRVFRPFTVSLEASDSRTWRSRVESPYTSISKDKDV